MEQNCIGSGEARGEKQLVRRVVQGPGGVARGGGSQIADPGQTSAMVVNVSSYLILHMFILYMLCMIIVDQC